MFFFNALVSTEVRSTAARLRCRAVQSSKTHHKIVVAVNYYSTHAVFGGLELPIEQPRYKNEDEEIAIETQIERRKQIELSY